MNVRKLISYEEKLMKFEESNKFSIDFNDYMQLLKLLKEIGEITSNYFILMREYDAKLKNDNLDLEKRKKKLTELNNKILDSNVEIDENSINEFIAKYNIK